MTLPDPLVLDVIESSLPPFQSLPDYRHNRPHRRRWWRMLSNRRGGTIAYR
jgi:hypothetical protein